MLVEDMMKKEVVTLQPTASIADALQLLQNHRIRHIPIVNERNHVIGIVSDRDVRDASPSILDSSSDQSVLHNEIQTIMSQPVISVHPLDFVEEIANIFYNEEIACVPVVRNHKLIGMITQKDMLSTLIQLTGTDVQGSHIEVKIKHRPKTLPHLTTFFGNRQINIISLLIYPYKDDPTYKLVVIRFQTMNPAPIINDLREAGYELMWPNEALELDQ
ncbi:MAG TPA: acetoin utilization AcuB family protein [Virgibacillus sp.]|nr:acetoin utilization AcuB family protein [Virgibacillus sp.]